MTTEQKVFQGAQKLHKFLVTLLEACHYTPKKKKSKPSLNFSVFSSCLYVILFNDKKFTFQLLRILNIFIVTWI